MRVREPSYSEFFTDLIFLGLSVPVVLFIINFFVSGVGPYDFTLLELLDIFYSSVDYIFLKLSPLINLFWIVAVIFGGVLLLTYFMQKASGVRKL